ncbi:MAG: Tetratricopeptide repeat domain protein [Candidatus Wolfebacteria bacterium GW2011_GWC2_39_22]|uniref:Tetratricopeptide repeat domain protein n=1 Tax=Candidatus Wolfebacteria bacterium GW2011_GWC2_39_22 TaxID=1619013 RepID=A0A0G0N6W3_9BACT|nr:MAG: Tetratricopeptide repeat domain protein [Candidatus Wolfebacteria bacterium GW2011_GWC2_39_22]
MKKIQIEEMIGKLKKLLLERKRQLIILILSLTIVLAGITLFAGRYEKKSNDTEQKPLTLIEQYRNQLPGLEIKAKSGNASDLQQYGIALYATGDLLKAEDVYKKQVTVDNGSLMAHNNLANILRDEKKYEEAISEYEKAIKISPKAINSYVNLASLYQYSLKNMDKAIEVYDRAIEDNPESIDFPNLAALAYEQIGDIENSQLYFKKTLTLQENNQTAKAGLERLKK